MTCLHGTSCLGSHRSCNTTHYSQLQKTCLQQISTVCAEVLEPILLLCWSVPRNRIVMKALSKAGSIKGLGTGNLDTAFNST